MPAIWFVIVSDANDSSRDTDTGKPAIRSGMVSTNVTRSWTLGKDSSVASHGKQLLSFRSV